MFHLGRLYIVTIFASLDKLKTYSSFCKAFCETTSVRYMGKNKFILTFKPHAWTSAGKLL